MQGYAKANSTVEAMDTLKWGTDYLLRTLAKTSKVGQKYPEYNIAYQVRLLSHLSACLKHSYASMP